MGEYTVGDNITVIAGRYSLLLKLLINIKKRWLHTDKIWNCPLALILRDCNADTRSIHRKAAQSVYKFGNILIFLVDIYSESNIVSHTSFAKK